MESKVPSIEELQRKIGKFVSGLKKENGNGMQDVRFNVAPMPDAEGAGVEDSTDATEEEFNLEFDLKPKEVKAYLDNYVIKQEEAKKTLAIAVCDHYNHVSEWAKQKRSIGPDGVSAGDEEEYTKQNVMMIGPTGVGKTYLIRTIARLIGVPFVKADATKFSETGYVGGNVDDMVRDLVNEAEGNAELAQYGMIYLDEVDKIASTSNAIGKDVSGRGVQAGLLKLMEETEVDLSTPFDPVSQMRVLMEFQKRGEVEKKTINTKHILFFVSGAFNQLDDIIKERLQEQGMGFGAEIKSTSSDIDYLGQCRSVDLVKYGFEPEFVGRLPVRVVCHELSAEDLFDILKHSEGSIIKQYRKAFKSYGIDATFSDESLTRISEKACEEKTGARALATICEKALREFKYELPSTDIGRLVVTAEMVDDPAGELRRLLDDPSENISFVARELVEEYAEEFMGKHEIGLKFTPEAVVLINEKATAGKTDVKLMCGMILEDYEHGLNLIKRNAGISEFTITKAVIEDPSGTLGRWVKEHYTRQPENV